MAKKVVQSEDVKVESADVETVETANAVAEKKETKKSSKKSSQPKNDKANAKADIKSKDKSKPKKEKKSLKKKMSEVWSELKKVSKPSFGKVVKNTCVVIAVVAICTVLLFGVDKLFSLLYDLLLP